MTREEKRASVRPGDILQCVPGSDWSPALVIVTETRDWGVIGYSPIPLKGEAPIRLAWEVIEPTGGKAVWVASSMQAEGY